MNDALTDNEAVVAVLADVALCSYCGRREARPWAGWDQPICDHCVIVIPIERRYAARERERRAGMEGKQTLWK